MEYVLNIIGIPQYSLKKAFAPLGFFVSHVYDHFIPHARNNYHPHLLGHRSLALMSGLLIAVKIFILTVVSFGPILPAFSSAITQENIINLTNQSRVEYGLQNLKQNNLLQKAAQAKAEDMLAKSYFAHNSPDGRTPWNFIVAAGYNYIMAGENLAVNYTEAENVESAWMNSPGHKANILNKDFEEIGIGIAQGMYQGHDAIFVVQEFGTPIEQKIQLANKPTTVQTEPVPPPLENKISVQSSVVSPVVKQSTTPIFETVKSAQAQEPVIPVNKILEPVNVLSGDVKLEGENILINAKVSGPVVKVTVLFGEKAIMLDAKEGGVWSGVVKATELTETKNTVRIKAYDINNKTADLQLADFSSGTIANYNLNNTNPTTQVKYFGLTFDPKSFETQVYLYMMAVLLSGMVLAVAIKRHVQHLSLVANSSFVVMFASLMYMIR